MNKEVLEKEVIRRYVEEKQGQDKIAAELHIGKLKIRNILKSNNIPTFSNKISSQFIVKDYHIKKYLPIEGKHYIAVFKKDGTVFNDYENAGGFLTSYIEKKEGIKTPTLHERRKYYQMTGNYWYEQWFDIKLVDNQKTKKCPYCGWETIDIENKSGVFEQHLKECHNKTIEDYLKEYPNDIDYFPKYKAKQKKNEMLNHEENFIICPICGEKFNKLTISHILTHGLSYDEFKKKYPDAEIMSEYMTKQAKECFKLSNLTVSKNRFISKYEREIQDFLTKHNIDFKANRQILIGKEIDMLIESKKIGIEFDGLKWHTEWFGKKRHNYHLEKTLKCNEKGYGLIHIFEDEYINHKDIVYSKISHILGLDYNLPKIMGRKCVVKQIYKGDAEPFLKKYHIQGFVSASFYLGAFFNDNLVAVMSFKDGNLKNNCWELTRFATDYHYQYQGLGSKIFAHFLKIKEPLKVISFADRRWTINPQKNLYINLGFRLDKFNPPDYKYYIDESKNGQKYERIHKMKMNKKMLSKKYGFPLTMTETEMARELGYDRIWDCGLIKYVWEAKNAV